MAKDRNARLDNLKALLMLLVVLQHSVNCSFLPHAVSVFAVGSFLFLGCTMPLFCIISGYQSKPAYKVSELIPLLILCVIFNTIGNVAWGTLGFCREVRLLTLAPTLWFLWGLLFFRVIAPFVYKSRIFLIICLMSAWIACFFPSSWGSPMLERVFAFMPFFCFGYSAKILDFKVEVSSKLTFYGGGSDYW